MHHLSLCRAHVQVSPDGYCLDRRARRLIFSIKNKWVTRSVFREEVERRGSAPSLQFSYWDQSEYRHHRALLLQPPGTVPLSLP